MALAGIRETTLSVDELLAAVRADRAGAVAVFVGMVRDHDHGAAVGELGYSSHPTAADLVHEVAGRHAATPGVVRVAVVHRVGDLQVGDSPSSPR